MSICPHSLLCSATQRSLARRVDNRLVNWPWPLSLATPGSWGNFSSSSPETCLKRQQSPQSADDDSVTDRRRTDTSPLTVLPDAAPARQLDWLG